MSDYSWIKPCIHAEIVGALNYPQFIGRIVTIKSYPEFDDSDDLFWVSVEEGIEFLNEVDEEFSEIIIAAKHLKPFNPPNWEGIADGSVECKSISKILKEIAPKVIYE